MQRSAVLKSNFNSQEKAACLTRGGVDVTEARMTHAIFQNCVQRSQKVHRRSDIIKNAELVAKKRARLHQFCLLKLQLYLEVHLQVDGLDGKDHRRRKHLRAGGEQAGMGGVVREDDLATILVGDIVADMDNLQVQVLRSARMITMYRKRRTSTSKEIVVSSRCHCPSTVKAVPKSCFVSDGSHIKACLDRNQAKKEVKRNVSYTLIGLRHLAPLVVSSLRVRQLLKPLEMLHPLSPRLPFLPAPELGRLHTAVLNQIQRPKSETFNGCSSCILAFDPESVETQLRGQQLLNVGMMRRVDLRAVAEECHSHAFNLSNLQAHEKDTYALRTQINERSERSAKKAQS